MDYLNMFKLFSMKDLTMIIFSFSLNCFTVVQLCVVLFYAQIIIFKIKLILLHGEK